MNRHLEPDFDQRIADWLEEDPNHAPREVLGTVLAAYPSIPQRRAWRMPWRFQPMFTNRLGIAAAVAVVLLVGVVGMSRLGTPTGQGGPQPTPTAAPTAAPTTAPTLSASRLPSFTINEGPAGFDEVQASAVYLYGMRYPSTWTLDAGIRPNEPDAIPATGFGQNDFYGDGKASGVYVTAGPVSAENPTLETLSGYVAAQLPRSYPMYAGPGCTTSTRALVLDGEPASETDFYCPAHTALWLTAIHRGLAYQVAWLDDGPFTASELQPRFDQFLQSFTFAP